MKKIGLIVAFVFMMASYGLACQADPKPTEPAGISNVNTFNPVNTNTFTPTINAGTTTSNSFSGIGGSVNPSSAASAGVQAASAAGAKPAAATGAAPVTGIGVSGIGQANNSGSGQFNSGIGLQNNGSGAIFNGDGAGSTNINTKYEEARQMAVVLSAAVTTALRFKEGSHQDRTDSRVMSVAEILSYGHFFSYEECKRGRGDVKIIDGLVRSQYAKTNQIVFHTTKPANPDNYRFMGFLTGIAASNDVGMENVVYGIGEAAMENGATDVVLVKESATEWGDTTGYAFDVGAFVTSIIGGAGSRSIGPGGTGSAGINGMKGGSADRSDVKFAVFVSNTRLQEVSAKNEKK